MAAEPTWPSNYLHAARIAADGDAAGMTLYWGEIFRLLEPGSERSAELAATMVEVLRSHVEVSPGEAASDRTVTTSLAPGAPVVEARADGTAVMPFVHAFELGVGAPLGLASLAGLSLSSLHRARAMLVQRWRDGGAWPDTELHRWLTALAAAGHLEAYDYWLYGPAFADEAEAWQSGHAAALDAMVFYLSEHRFAPTTTLRPDTRVPMPAAAGAAPTR